LVAEHVHDPPEQPTQLSGHVLSGRYKAQLVEGSGNGYLRTAAITSISTRCAAKRLAPEDRLLAYRWSSFSAVSVGPGNIGRDGCAPTGCWVSTALRRTHRQAGRSLSATWSVVGLKRWTRKRSRFSAGLVYRQRGFPAGMP